MFGEAFSTQSLRNNVICHERDYSTEFFVSVCVCVCVLQAQLAGLLGPSARLKELRVRVASLAAESAVPADIQSSVSALASRYDSTLQLLMTREQEINAGKHNDHGALMMMMMMCGFQSWVFLYYLDYSNCSSTNLIQHVAL